MKKKNIYDELHELNGSLDKFEKVELSEIEKHKLKKAFKSQVKKPRVNLKKVGTVAACFVLVLVIIGHTKVGSSVYANVISVLKDIKFSMLSTDVSEGNNDMIAEDNEALSYLKPYLCDVNMTAKDKDVEIKLSDVLISEDKFVFSCILHKDNIESKSYGILDYDIYINGELAKIEDKYGSGYRTKEGLDYKTLIHRIEGINTTEDLPIKIKINCVNASVDHEHIKGNWEFNFTANGKKLAEDSIVKELNQNFTKNDITVTFKKIVYNPLDKVIYAEISQCDIDDDFVLKGEDDLGNKFSVGIHTQNGKLASFQNAGEEQKIIIGKGAKQLKLCLYYRRLPKSFEGSGPKYEKFGEEFIIDLQ